MFKDEKTYDAIIVGGGIAGLTAAAYLSKYGYETLVLEKQDAVGGLINSFNYKGFLFDGGIRSIESSGVVKPMIRDLKLDIDFNRSYVTLGIKDQVIALSRTSDIKSYESLLISLFPDDEKDISRIIRKIYRILLYMDVLYGIDNPMIVDIKANPSYVIKTLFPWFFKFVPTLYHIKKLTVPVESYLKKYTQNQALIDMIAQHFFKDTPAFFALGYFNIYFDYHYPKGGTGELPKALENYILKNGGKINTQTTVNSISIKSKIVKDTHGQIYRYKKLIWAADLKALYNQIDLNALNHDKLKQKVTYQIKRLENKTGAESVLTVYALTDLDPSYFRSKSSEHFFYTPKTTGLSQAKLPKSDDMTTLMEPLKQFLDLNTYEISIPALRDENLAPENHTGLIISILLDYEVIRHIKEKGYYTSFKSFVETYMIEVLSKSIFPTLKDHTLETFCSTPLTFKNRNSSTDGAIVGWAYTNKPIPVIHEMSKITKSIKTILPDVYQAGQWSFSPAGVPISVITGKLAADATKRYLKKIR